MRRVIPNITEFKSTKGYTLHNSTINFGDILAIYKVVQKPIGMDEEFYSIRFSGNNKNTYFWWFYPNENDRNTQYDELEAILNDGTGGDGNTEPAAQEATLQSVLEELTKTFERLGKEKIVVSDITVESLTVPTGAVGAVIQNQSTTKTIRVTVGDDNPSYSEEEGEIVTGLGYVDVGKTISYPNQDSAELANFKAIAEPGENIPIYIIYYGIKSSSI